MNRSFANLLSRKLLRCALALTVPAILSVPTIAQEATKSQCESKGVSLFDGKSLAGWKGLPAHWSVEDGAITGINTEANPLNFNTFLVYEKPVSDFELTLKFRIKGGNSGIQYRSKVLDEEKFIVGGYQADIDSNKRFMGINYEEKGRAILVERGEIVTIGDDGKKTKTGSCGNPDELLTKIKFDDWNEYRIVAKDFKLQHFINGVLMSELQDGETAKRTKEGVIAFQVHQGPPMKVQFKDIVLSQ